MSIDVVNVQPAPSGASSVSWGAISVGAVVATAATISLALLAAGLGLTLVSPWASQNASATTFAVSAGIAVVVVQWASSLLGGYIAGRLRPDWEDADSDERFFRDTAHGFAVWCVASILVATLTFMSAAGVTRGAADLARGAASATASAAQTAAGSDGVQQYTTDLLFRGAANPVSPERRAEAARIIATDVANGSFPDQDRAYLSQMVASAAGLSPDDARKRVDQTIATLEQAKTKAQEAAETARKAASRGAMLAFLSLVIGAFIASAAAAYGGSLRSDVRTGLRA